MNRLVLGGLITLALVALGLFWWQGRAEVEQGAPPPMPQPVKPAPDVIPSADTSGLRGPAPPVGCELSKEEQRFFRYDRNRDRRITRNEMLATRTEAFRKLDTDGNNLLDFEEWAVATAQRFDSADRNRNRELDMAEFATTAPKPAKKKPGCAC